MTFMGKTLNRLRGCASDQGLLCPHMPEDTFSHGAAHLVSLKTIKGTIYTLRASNCQHVCLLSEKGHILKGKDRLFLFLFSV